MARLTRKERCVPDMLKMYIRQFKMFLKAVACVAVILSFWSCATSHISGLGSNKEFDKTASADYERIGDTYYHQKNYQMAFVKYDRAVSLNPENVHARYKKALARLAAGQYPKALEEFATITNDYPEYALTYEGRGRAFFLLDDKKQAMESFHKAISMNPDLWLSHAYLGILYDSQKQHANALKEHRTAIRLQPNEGALYNNLGISYLMVSDYDRAVRAFETALAKNYQHQKVYNNLGYALSKIGLYKEAYQAFQKAGGPAAAYNNLGCGFMANEDMENAMVYFRKALEIKPEFYKKAADNIKKAEYASRQ